MTTFMQYCQKHVAEVNAWQVGLILQLQSIGEGHHSRLIVLSPKTFGKTFFAQMFVRYLLETTDQRILYATYGLLMCEHYQRKASHDRVRYTYPGGSLVGEGCFDIGIIDGWNTDVLSVFPQTAYNWYHSNFVPRLKGNAPMIYMGQEDEGFVTLLQQDREWQANVHVNDNGQLTERWVKQFLDDKNMGEE